MEDRVARLDQLGAAMRAWAETVAVARDQLIAAGFSREEAVAIAHQWIMLVINHQMVGHVA